MRRITRDDTALLVVDMQERLLPVIFEGERVISGCDLLLRAAHQFELPVVLTEQNPRHLGPTLPSLLEAAGGVTPISKMTFSACTETVLGALRDTGRNTILLCGVEAHVCVLQTALDLVERGFAVFAVLDAMSSRRSADHQLARERMRRSGVLPASVESAVFELMERAGTPEFRKLLPLIR